jgi:uncharacterized membrane protein YfcA
VTLVAVAFLAATVNGALGYGFSSMTVPVALVFLTNRILNPAIVLVELALNGYVLFVNRRGLASTWRRVLPIQIGLVLGVGGGSYVLLSIAPGWLKLWTYALLLPLILLQAAGVRRPIRAERLVGVPFGAGVGVLYSLTTISGPPLALLFNNQGFAKEEFRAGLALVRMTESTLTAVAYGILGLYTYQSSRLLLLIVPGVAVGVPLGAHLIRRIEADTFRRICMSFDAWVVGFGCSHVVVVLGLLPSPSAYGILLLVVLVDAILYYSSFSRRRTARRGSVAPPLAVGSRPALSMYEQQSLKGLRDLPEELGRPARND